MRMRYVRVRTGGVTSDDSSGGSGMNEDISDTKYGRKLAAMAERNREYRKSGAAKKSQQLGDRQRRRAVEILKTRHWAEYEDILAKVKSGELR